MAAGTETETEMVAQVAISTDDICMQALGFPRRRDLSVAYEDYIETGVGISGQELVATYRCGRASDNVNRLSAICTASLGNVTITT